MPPALQVTPRLETAKTPQSHPWIEELSPVHSSTGVPRAPHCPCLGIIPTPLDHKEGKLAATEDHDHHIMVKGSGYELGFSSGELFSSCVFMYLCCLLDFTHISYFWLRTHRNRDSQPQRALTVLQNFMKMCKNSTCTVKNRFTGMSLVTAVSSNTENTELVHSHGRTRKSSGL